MRQRVLGSNKCGHARLNRVRKIPSFNNFQELGTDLCIMTLRYVSQSFDYRTHWPLSVVVHLVESCESWVNVSLYQHA